MSKIERPEFLVNLLEGDRKINYHLVKPDDENFIKKAEKIAWVTFKEDGTFKEIKPEIEVGCSLILDPQFGKLFTWQTTEVTEIVEKTNAYIIFKTKNSLYKLEKV